MNINRPTLAVLSAACALLASAEEPFAFRERMLELHPQRLRADAPPLAADETAVDASWRIVLGSDDPVVRHAADDLADFFAKSMGLAVSRAGDSATGNGRIFVSVDATLKALQSKIEVGEREIRISGCTAREAMQGCYRLEDELGLRGRPAVKRGMRTYTRRFSPRMTHSGYELEKFPDAYMDQIAHAGMDAILVFIADPPDVTRNGREDIPALVERAKLHGLDVYAYASFHKKAAKMHPLDPGAREWYDETYGSIVKNAPGLKGLVCVGESVGYPSRDKGAGGFWFDPEPGKLMNGFNPFSDWPDWIRLVTDVTRKYKSDFDIIFWTYNWFQKPDAQRIALVESIPTNVTLLVTWDRGDPPVMKCGAKSDVGDYTVTVPGPSHVFVTEADAASRRGMKVMTISNTAGRTWDLGAGVPYIPTPWRWFDRCEALRRCNEERGLKALMDSHHYGFAPSFVSDFIKTLFTEETDPKDAENILSALAVRDFGAAAAPAALKAWKDWSESFLWHSALDRDQSGPSRVGPAYPIVRPGVDNPPPVRPFVSESKKNKCPWMYMFPRFVAPRHVEMVSAPGQIDGEIEWAERELALAESGNAALREAIDLVPETRRADARRQLAIGEYMAVAARSLLNVKRYYRDGCRFAAAADGSAEARAAYRAMLATLRDEDENVRRAIPVAEADSAIGWEATMGYQADVSALRHKLRLLADERIELESIAKRRGVGEPPGSVKTDSPAQFAKTVSIAAEEFAKYYREITGRDVAEDPVEVRISVDTSLPTDGNDGYRIRSTAKGVDLVGVNGRSALYAVYDLLERRGGCRWFWDGDVVPKRDAIDLAGLDVLEKSRFAFRATRYFSHRGLTRFRAQQWGPEDWKREIDYLAKIRVNTFMLRIGQDDMFQQAFPDVCKYPDVSKPLPGVGTEYDNLSLFWSLQFRGLLRRMVTQYGFDRGFMIPEDFGTMTHWYSRTPQDFLDAMDPPFLPQSTSGYSEPSGLVWDIRDDKWMDMYWKLTEASIRAYGSSEILHTMGLSERNCYSNRADNLKLKIDVMKRLCAGARKRYPGSTIILGGWDFHHTWFPDELKKLWPELSGFGNTILWDYEADAIRNYRPEMPKANNITMWDVIGRFPYTFGLFHAFAHSSDIRANYPVIEKRWQAVGDDPFCRGYIWWPEVEHSDILFYEYFAANSWRPGTKVEEIVPGFCRRRYGDSAAAMERIWTLARPMTEGVDWGTLFATEVTRANSLINFTNKWNAVECRAELSGAPELFRLLADVDWNGDFIRRDTLDIARTVADRLIVAAATKVFRAYHGWKAGKVDGAALARLAGAYERLGAAMADTLALHTDYSLWESFVRMNEVEEVRNPSFEKVLVDNASCHYCRSYQYELAEHWYKPEMANLAKAIRAAVDEGDRANNLFVFDRTYREKILSSSLETLAPKTPRTPENYRRAMLALAEAAADML